MIYRNLTDCVDDLEKTGQLKRLSFPVDPYLELAAIQRRAWKKGGPALLFTNVKGCSFPVLANLFGTMERAKFIFRHSFKTVELLLKYKADPLQIVQEPLKALRLIPSLYTSLLKTQDSGSVLQHKIQLSQLPQIVSWPQDGGAFITLPLVSTLDPQKPHIAQSNLGMYRIQISGNDYIPDKEAGMHYQLHRGIGVHHAKALAMNKALPVSIAVGGSPALSLSAIMPLPEGISEFTFANILAGFRIPLLVKDGMPPIAAESDFCIYGYLSARSKPEGPFGDHLGYYSLQHDFPVLHIQQVSHRPGAIWLFTSVGRPPQEDTIFGTIIHELTSPMVPATFHGIHELHAVDAAGVHPLLLAIGSERYVPYEEKRQVRELLTQCFHLLGTTQTSLSKYILMAAREDAPELSTKNIGDFFTHILERTDLQQDVHILTRTNSDTLDYTGKELNRGSKMLWLAAGEKKRELARSIPDFHLPFPFSDLRLFRPGILVCKGPKHCLERDISDPLLEELMLVLSQQKEKLASCPLVLLVDNCDDVCASWENFLFTMCTRSDPSTDSYGVGAYFQAKHWACSTSLLIDARAKRFHPPLLEEDPEIEKKIDNLSVKGKELYTIC